MKSLTNEAVDAEEGKSGTVVHEWPFRERSGLSQPLTEPASAKDEPESFWTMT